MASDKSTDTVLCECNDKKVLRESDETHLMAENPEDNSSGCDKIKEQETGYESVTGGQESSLAFDITEEHGTGENNKVSGDPKESSSGCDIIKDHDTDDEAKLHKEQTSKQMEALTATSNAKNFSNLIDTEEQLENSTPKDSDHTESEHSSLISHVLEAITKQMEGSAAASPIASNSSQSDSAKKSPSSNQKHEIIYKKGGETITVVITETNNRVLDGKGVKHSPTDGNTITVTPSKTKVADSSRGQRLPGEHDIFVCKVCRQYFVYSAFRKHVVEHTQKETEVCCACGYFNENGGRISAHPNCHVCWQCRLLFKSSQLLKHHIEWHKEQKQHGTSGNRDAFVEENENKCKEHDYSKTFGYQKMEVELDGMEIEQTSADAEKLACENDVVMCFEEMEENRDLSKEVEIDSLASGTKLPDDSDVMECRLCNKYFVYSLLRKHVKQDHTMVKTGVCSACGYFDVEGGKLKDHPDCYVCWGCSVFFKCSNSLKRHIAWHRKVGKEVVSRKEASKRKKADNREKKSPVTDGKGKGEAIETRSKTTKRLVETTKTVKKALVLDVLDKKKSNSLEQVLECRLCNDFFLYSSLKEHVIQHTKKETEICLKCGYYEKNGGKMKKHPSCFVCWTCSIFFNSSMKLKEHMQLHDIPDENDEWHMCMICMARFCHANGLKEHMRWHEGEHEKVDLEMKRKEHKARVKQQGKEDSGKRHIRIKALVTRDEEDAMKLCVRCNMFFKSQKSLKRHVKNAHTHTDTELCEKCGFFEKAGGPVGLHDCVKEINKMKRKVGKKERNAEGRYKCNLCTKTYAFSQGLRAHVATHVPKEDRPYCCSHCPKKFAKKILLQDHLRVHTGEKPFLCHKCAKTFRSGANLRQHSRRCKGSAPKNPTKSEPPQTLITQPSLYGYPNPQVRFYSKPVTSSNLPTLTPENSHVEQQSVVYEVQMQVNEDGDSTVVINLDNIGEIKTYTQNASNPPQLQNNTDMEGFIEGDYESKMRGEQTTENQPVPVKIYACPFKPNDITGNEGEMQMQSSQVKAACEGNSEEGQEGETVSHSQGNETSDTGKGGEVTDELYYTTDDNNEDWVDDEDCTEESTEDPGDHDYINGKEKLSSSILEEKQNQDVKKPRLLEIMNMCRVCKGLFESKVDIKEHIKSIHKKETKFDGIVVLALPRGNTSKPEDSDESEDESDENQDTLPLQWSYSCSHCHELFAPNEIDDHLKSVELKKGQCPTCFRMHKGQSKVKQAMVRCRLSRARRVYQCPYCNDIKRVTLAELKAHLKNRHELTEYSCTLCDKSFKSRRSMAVHMKVHVNRQPKEKKRYICEKCNKECNDRVAFRIHRMQHDNPKPFQCKLCPKAYSFPNGLKVHMRGHNNEYPYLCEYCSRAFKTKHCLMCHIRCHTGIKPFVCDGCGKKFRTKGNLRQHTQRCTAVSQKEELDQLEQIQPITISQEQEQDTAPIHQEQIEITSADLVSMEEIKIHLLKGVTC